MITENDILLALSTDSWFSPSRSKKKKIIKDKDGKEQIVAKSYYHVTPGGVRVRIRVSDHGTKLETWIKRGPNPAMSLQNLSVVFSDLPINYSLNTAGQIVGTDEKGNPIKKYTYFVVEQYLYLPCNISMNDFKRIINKIKTISSSIVFNDPLYKEPKKRASRTVLTPNDEEGEAVPQSTNPVHPRQTIVANNKEKEIDANGNIITESELRHIIREALITVLYS